MKDLSMREEQSLIWDYFKPRHTHAWNMLVLSWRELDKMSDEDEYALGFETEYFWENFILRLCLYRTTVRTLTKLNSVRREANKILKNFDRVFDTNGRNGLIALRDMFEHFDDYASGKGKGPGLREKDLDPYRLFTRDRYERGQFYLERQKSYEAAIKLCSEAGRVSGQFILWYRQQNETLIEPLEQSV